MIKTTIILFLIMTFSYATDDELSFSDSYEELIIPPVLCSIKTQEKQEIEDYEKQFSSLPLRDNELTNIWETIRELESIYCRTWLDNVARKVIGKRNIIALSNIKGSLEGKNQYILQQKTASIIENLSDVGPKARIQEQSPKTLETKLLKAEAAKIKTKKEK
jgi:hypothetical protein